LAVAIVKMVGNEGPSVPLRERERSAVAHEAGMWLQAGLKAGDVVAELQQLPNAG
jgi:hypothetical protein